jgi:hypothetical protein
MLSGFLIEDYILALIRLSKSRSVGDGPVQGHRRCAPYEVAVLIGFEDVEGRNQRHATE